MRMYYTIIRDGDYGRYVDHKQPSTMTVAATEPDSKFSGLYDASGNNSRTRTEPIGFIHYRDAV